METFEWIEPKYLAFGKQPMGKIISKIPMQKKVVTEHNEIWEYEILNGKPTYQYNCTFALKD